MLQKGMIYWAVALGTVAAAGTGGAIWRLRGAAVDGAPPAQTVVSSPKAASASPQPVSPATQSPSAPKKDVAAPADVAALSAPPKQNKLGVPDDIPRPQFDIVRVDTTGEAVIAGHAAPRAKIAVTDRGDVVARTEADESGQFVILPPAFGPGGHALGLIAQLGDGASVQSPGVVGVDVPQPQAPAPASKSASAAASPAAEPTPSSAPSTSHKTILATAQSSSAPSPPPSAPSRTDAMKPSPSKPAQSNFAANTAPAPPASPRPAAATRAPDASPPAILPAQSNTPVAPKAAAPLVVATIETPPPAAAAPRTVITGVAADEAGRMVATGAAAPGAFLRLYLNGSFLASVTAGDKGLWSLTVEHGLTRGAYAIRADEIDRARDIVISRAEVPFNYPGPVAEATGAKQAALSPPMQPVAAPRQLAVSASEPPRASSAPAPAAATRDSPVAVAAQPQTGAAPSPGSGPPPAVVASAAPPKAVDDAAAPASTPAATKAPTQAAAANAIVRAIDTRKVVRGDSLWAISEHLYGNGLRYTQIYAANASQIRNPALIYIGQVFVLPQPTPY